MVLSDVLQTSRQHLLFLNSISTGLKGNVKSSGLTYAMLFPVMVWHWTKDVLLSLSTKDTIPVWPGYILTLFLATNGIEICCMYITWKHNLAMQKVVPMMYALTQYHMSILNHKLVF